jgi:hypothetical protein
MDWQQPTALLIVALTAGAFAWNRVRRKRRPGLPCGCGCPAASSQPQTGSITLRARKGERPQVIVRPR